MLLDHDSELELLKGCNEGIYDHNKAYNQILNGTIYPFDHSWYPFCLGR